MDNRIQECKCQPTTKLSLHSICIVVRVDLITSINNRRIHIPLSLNDLLLVGEDYNNAPWEVKIFVLLTNRVKL